MNLQEALKSDLLKMAHIYEIVLVLSYILGFVYMFKIAKSVDSRRQFAVLDKVSEASSRSQLMGIHLLFSSLLFMQ